MPGARAPGYRVTAHIFNADRPLTNIILRLREAFLPNVPTLADRHYYYRALTRLGISQRQQRLVGSILPRWSSLLLGRNKAWPILPTAVADITRRAGDEDDARGRHAARIFFARAGQRYRGIGFLPLLIVPELLFS